jgi:hypothetical protein
MLFMGEQENHTDFKVRFYISFFYHTGTLKMPNCYNHIRIFFSMPRMVAHICNPNYMGGIGRRIVVQGHPQTKSSKTLLEK